MVDSGCRPGNRAVWLALMVTGTVLQGCAQPQVAQRPSARLYAVDQAGAAKNCNAGAVVPVAGKDTPVAMKMGNDGGWCAVSVTNDRKPFAAGLLASGPSHGKVLIHTVGNDTRIDYTPTARFTGTDAFAVKLIPGDAVLQVSVTIGAS